MDKMTRSAAAMSCALVLSACTTMTPPSETGIAGNMSPPRAVIAPARTEQSGELLSLRFDRDYTEDSIYWQPPTTITIQNNGDYYIYVQRLANMRRMPGLIDQGWHLNFGLNIAFFSGGLVADRCAGTVLYSTDLGIAGLRYKMDRSPVTRSGNDPNFPRMAGAFGCTETRMYWR